MLEILKVKFFPHNLCNVKKTKTCSKASSVSRLDIRLQIEHNVLEVLTFSYRCSSVTVTLHLLSCPYPVRSGYTGHCQSKWWGSRDWLVLVLLLFLVHTHLVEKYPTYCQVNASLDWAIFICLLYFCLVSWLWTLCILLMPIFSSALMFIEWKHYLWSQYCNNNWLCCFFLEWSFWHLHHILHELPQVSEEYLLSLILLLSS